MNEGRAGDILRFEHPGAGRRRAKARRRRAARCSHRRKHEVAALLGDRPRAREFLIEHLHLIQDTYHQISAAHLAALADEMQLAYAEVYETATFYAHFDVVKEGEPPLAPLVVRVCDSITCAMFGAERLLAELRALPDANGLSANVRVVRAPCVGLVRPGAGRRGRAPFPAQGGPGRGAGCDRAGRHPSPYPGRLHRLRRLRGRRRLPPARPAPLGRDERGRGARRRSTRAICAASAAPGSRPARKWRSVRGEPGPRLMAVNADEGEPGTFKDRHYLNSDPHRFLEGMLIGAHVVEAEEIYLYLRDEYPVAREILTREIAKLPAGGPSIHMRRGAGAYICGEESSMLESLEGKRGLPRHKPPFPFQVGLFGRPTLINNVETLYWVRDLVEKGAAWWTSFGRNGRKGLRSFSVSGRVKEPGVKLAPAGITVRELIDEYCGGMMDGHSFTAYLPGGASGGILPASMSDIPLDFGTLEKHGCFIGSAAVVVFSDQDDVSGVALNLMRFFEDESCGQCTPCRSGTQKARMLMERGNWDADLLGELSQVMADASICGLGQAAANPLTCFMRYFPEALAPKEAAE